MQGDFETGTMVRRLTNLGKSPGMIVNYSKTAVRNFIRDGVVSWIVLGGLAIGFACILMISQYICFERSFDSFHPDADRIHLAYMHLMHLNDSKREADLFCHPAIAPFVLDRVPDVVDACRIVPVAFDKGHEILVRWGNEADAYSREKQLYHADAGIFRVFNIPVLHGNHEKLLSEPGTAVLTERFARKIFGKDHVLDKTLKLVIYGATHEYKITAVVADQPANSSLQFNALFSLAEFPEILSGIGDGSWQHPIYTTYLKLSDHANTDDVTRAINDATKATFSKIADKFLVHTELRLHPFTDMHFFSMSRSYVAHMAVKFSGDRRMIVYFATLAGLILMISLANYVNLNTARALRRAKEMGIRKTTGASRKQLILQLLVEGLLVNVGAAMIAFTITQFSFGSFSKILGSSAHWTLWQLPMFWLLVITFILVSTLLSGIYPAVLISRYNPAVVLKGNYSRSPTGIAVRKLLVSFQFVFTIVLLLSIYVIGRQLSLLQKNDLKVVPKQLLVIRTTDMDSTIDRKQSLDLLRTTFTNRPEVKAIAASAVYPGERGVMDTDAAVHFFHRDDIGKSQVRLSLMEVSDGYFSAMSIPFVSGREFSNDGTQDTDKIILSDLAIAELGFDQPADAIGEKVRFTTTDRQYEVIGVVSSQSYSGKWKLMGGAYLNSSWYNQVTPIFNYILVSLEAGHTTSSISLLRDQWKTLFSGEPFDYFFLDEVFENFYNDERRFAGVFGFFSFVGVAITCMGLYGLNLYNITIRTKEIGIRKTLGGSSGAIIWLFSKSYLALILLASLVAVPTGWIAMNWWLQNYPNRVSVSVDIMTVPVLATIGIAGLTVGYHTYMLAHANPAKSLRSD